MGLNAIQGCGDGAAVVVVVDTSDAKLDMARAHRRNARRLAAATEENVVRRLRQLTDGGADFAFECVGLGAVLAQAYGCLRKGGTAVMVGGRAEGSDDDPHQHPHLRGEVAHRQLLRLGAAARHLRYQQKHQKSVNVAILP